MSRKKAPEPPEGAQIAGLIRKSEVRHPDDCQTPEQRALYEDELVRTRMAELVSDAARDGLTITRWYVDLDVSGRAAADHRRQGLHQLLADARAGQVRTLYARELARIYRDTVKSILFKTEMVRLGVDVRARDMVRSDDTATETLVQTIQFAVDQFQAERTGLQIRSRNLAAFQADQWTGYAQSLWGLRYDPSAKRFEFDPETAPRLTWVLEALVAERGNAHRAADRLNAAVRRGEPGAWPTPGGSYWVAGTVLRLAESPYYRRRGSYLGQTRPQPELIPAAVPPELLEEVDRVLGLRRETLGGRRARGGREVYTYGPLLRCADCGGRLKAFKYASPPAAEPISWMCRAASESRALCPGGWSFGQGRLERLVASALRRAIGEALASAPAVAEQNHGPEGEEAPKRAARGRGPAKNISKGDPAAALERLGAQAERTMRLYTSGVTQDFDWVQAEVRRIEAQKKMISAQLLAEQARDQGEAAPALSPADWRRLQDALAATWAPGPSQAFDPAKRDLLLALGVTLTARTRPRTRPTVNRGKVGAKFRNTGGPLEVTVEVARLGRAGGEAITVAETEDEWYDGLCASRSGGRRKEERREEEKG